MNKKDKNCKKIQLLPYEQEGGRQPRNFTGSLFLRNTPGLDIALKLGRIKGYDDTRRILSTDGKYISGSDISMLIEEAMTPKRVLVGMDEFIKLLAKANVDPDQILNDNIKKKLISVKNQKDVASSSINKRNNPVVVLERLNLDEYRHLLGKGMKNNKKGNNINNVNSKKKKKKS